MFLCHTHAGWSQTHKALRTVVARWRCVHVFGMHAQTLRSRNESDLVLLFFNDPIMASINKGLFPVFLFRKNMFQFFLTEIAPVLQGKRGYVGLPATNCLYTR